MNGGRSLENMIVRLRTELDHGHIVLTDAGMPLDDTFGILSLAERIKVLAQRINDTEKALQEISRLARAAQYDLADIVECGSQDKTEEERAALVSIQVKVQAILRNACEALAQEANDEG